MLPFVREKLASPEFKKLLDTQEKVLKELEITPRQLREELLGDAILFSFRQGPASKAEQDQGLFLIWARDKALLNQLLDRLNTIQKKTGELQEVRSHSYNDRTFYERIKLKNAVTESEYYFVKDNLLAFSSQLDVLKGVIDREKASLPADKKLVSFWSKLFDQLELQKSLFVLLVNPRSIDIELNLREKTAQGEQLAFLRQFRKYWQAFEGLALYADSRIDCEFGLSLQVRLSELPAPADNFLPRSASVRNSGK